MTNLRKLAMGAVTGGLMSITIMGTATAQADSVVRLDINAVSQELELSEETSRELAPLLDRLNAAFERREEHWRESDEIFEEIADTHEEIARTLSATELREFHWLMRGAAYGPGVGRPYGRFYNDGRMRAFSDRWPAVGGGRGYYGRARPMLGTRGYTGRGVPMRGVRRGAGWYNQPGWRPDGFDPKD